MNFQGFACPACGHGSMRVFHRVSAVPVNSCILMKTREEALNYPVGDIALGYCDACGFISNTLFDEKLIEYSGRYEETQGFSDVFKAFHLKLAEDLIDKYELRNKTIIEIGCGKGEFLSMLCELGDNRGIGFDPAYIEERNKSDAKDRVEFIVDFYSEKYADIRGDFVVCKMTLEHIHQVSEFVQVTRKSIGGESATTVFFQIPDAYRILKNCAFEDIYYEHCSYFTGASLRHLFSKNRFEILNVSTTYDDQYLTIEARPGDRVFSLGPSGADELNELGLLVDNFSDQYQKLRSRWDLELSQFAAEGLKVVLWGSGSKAVSFLTTSTQSDSIKYVVDINPHKTGFFMPGSGQEIVGPDFLENYQPDVVIVMNRIYSNEVKADLSSRGLAPRLSAL